MSWIKNKFNKLFKMDLYEEYDEQESYTNTDTNEQNKVQPDFNEQADRDRKKKAFRFPLIEDEFKEAEQKEEQQRQTTSFYDEDNEKLSLPSYLQKSSAGREIYDVEVSGIGELLERRRKGKGHSNVIQKNDPVRRMPILKEDRENLRKKPTLEEKHVSNQAAKPIELRKRFIPTDVPSPVHGFKKPTPIEKLIEKHQEAEEQQKNEVPELTVNIEPENIEALNQFSEEAVEHSTEPVQQETVEQSTSEELLQHSEIVIETETSSEKELILFEVEDDVSEQQDLTEATDNKDLSPPDMVIEEVEEKETIEETTAAETMNDVQVKHVTIENSTIHIGQLNVEQIPSTDESTVIEQKSEETVKPVSTGSRLPFNVVMLKSDKQKLLTKKFVEQQLSQQKHIVIESEVVEEGIKEDIEEGNGQNELVNSEMTMTTTFNNEVATTQRLDNEQNNLIDTNPLALSDGQEEDKTETIILQHEPLQKGVDSEVRTEPINDLTLTSVGLLERDENVQQPLEELLEVAATTEVQELPLIEHNSEEAIETPQLPKRIPYVKPPLEYLVPPEEMVEDRDWMDEQGENLVEALSHFQIQAHIESIVQGPAVTQFEITVGQGTKVSKVRNLTDDIKLALAAKDIRIDAPIPGKRSIGIEIPNRISRSVRLSEVTDSASFTNSDSPLEAALGLDLTGKPVTIDLRKMPHGLIAGATGSGKSVCINSILVSLLYKANPNELKLMLIDPKMVELAPFNHIPHLVSPVITDVKAATAALKWAVEEMERRYQLFMHSGARKIEAYNKMCDANGMYAQKLPYLLIVIDELADLMMMSPQDVEDSIVRITQKARAAGIHLIVATQRPSVDVITGLIKSNIPTRIAFSVSSQIDSRTILDTQGAERLLGRGDMLYLGNGMSAPTRIQGTFVTDDEIEEIIEYVREQGEPQYIFKQEELLKRSETVEDQDELFEEVCRFVYEQGSASTSLLQRRYHIGYNRAARLIDMLERQGFVSEPKGSKPRDVFITEEDLVEQFGG
ncbi:DNA translocase FtsK [Solibacillus merdavium]|uniref:DNA translocase FtsK n=1 Tax=Solibacillus merdavium TaxID=2762218 RepID=A0ABR8XRW8_9BACL|nr:DNA translocase FtsK [Solibacillus merdavium]MBD8034698.1 DNA translocase FtsK [Solibacillus merdavium]